MPNRLQQALPRAQAAFVQGAKARHGALVRRSPQVQQQADKPGQGAGQVGPVQAQRAHGVQEHGGQALEDRQVGDGKHLFRRQVAGVAVGGTHAGCLRVEHDDLAALACQLQGAGDADNAGADYDDVCLLGIGHDYASRWPSSRRRNRSGLSCCSAVGSKVSGKSW